MEYSKDANTLVVGYTNGNVDLIEGNTIYNLADIKRKQLYGSKSINKIFILNSYAYLTTGFGIVKIDLERKKLTTLTTLVPMLLILKFMTLPLTALIFMLPQKKVFTKLNIQLI